MSVITRPLHSLKMLPHPLISDQYTAWAEVLRQGNLTNLALAVTATLLGRIPIFVTPNGASAFHFFGGFNGVELARQLISRDFGEIKVQLLVFRGLSNQALLERAEAALVASLLCAPDRKSIGELAGRLCSNLSPETTEAMFGPQGPLPSNVAELFDMPAHHLRQQRKPEALNPIHEIILAEHSE